MGDVRALSRITEEPVPLSAEQRSAVTSESRYVRVIAGAGTGKTETIIRRTVYLLLYDGVEPGKIVAFTFTEKAAASMRNRVYDRLKRLGNEEGCARLGSMYIGTIHGFCLRLLEEHFRYGDHDVLDENQEFALLTRNGWSLGLGKGGRYDRNCQAFLRSVNVVNDELLDRGELVRLSPRFSGRMRQYEDLLERHRYITFGGLISRAVASLRENPGAVDYIEHLLVDEYQDINRAQECLIRSIGEGAAVFAVGDPRQSIYQWRGSDEACFDDFTRHFEHVRTLPISENRRSVQRIVELANSFADTFERRRYKHLVPTRTGRGYAFLVEFETPGDEAEWVVGEIDRLVSGGSCRYGDCAVLLRSVTTSGPPFIEALRRRGMPYVAGGKVGLFQRDEAQAAGRLLAWLSDDGFWVEDPWNWSGRTAGDGLLETGIALWRDATGLEVSKERLARWRGSVHTGGFGNLTEAYQELLNTLGFLDLDFSKAWHAAAAANLGAMSNLLTDFETPMRLGGRKPGWESVAKNLCWYLNTYATGAYEQAPAEGLGGLDAVALMTVHQAKGLEWPVVFIPAMTSSRFPSKMVGRRQEWQLPRPMFAVDRYEGSVDDERRLFYVAMTRSKDILCISRFRRISNPCGESAFVGDLGAGLRRLEPAEGLPPVEIGSSREDEIRTFQASEVLTYLRCPHLYRIREIWNYRPGLATRMGYGKSLHYCLRYASELVRGGIEVKDAIAVAIEERFHMPFAGREQLETMRAEAELVLLRFAEEHADDMGRIEEVETRLEFPVRMANITGRVDVIIRGDDYREVRDYKTTDTVATLSDMSFQVCLYASGLGLTGRPVDRATIAYLNESRLEEITLSPRRLRGAVATAEHCIEGILEQRFDPRPGEHCVTCDYSRICRSDRGM